MKKIIIIILSILFSITSQAQIAEFFSLQSASLEKDSNGNFGEVERWIGQEIYINIDLTQKKVALFSKGMLDRDTFRLMKEISISYKSPLSEEVNENLVREFSGIDKLGKQCTVALKLFKDAYKTQDGELRVEYSDRAEIYRIRAVRHNPRFNKN
jgi:hypothetical protein